LRRLASGLRQPDTRDEHARQPKRGGRLVRGQDAQLAGGPHGQHEDVKAARKLVFAVIAGLHESLIDAEARDL
jgi:hypothetical protein